MLQDLAKEAPLSFVSSRHLRAPLACWLQKHLGSEAFKNARLIVVGLHESKYAYIKQLGLKYFVEDRNKTVLELAEKGITPIVYQQPWNEGRHKQQIVRNWSDIRALCL